MANRLALEQSPYLLQHKDNPVDWYPWGDAAFEKARREDKPIFLSIGYSTCHWCHVMEHESFENAALAGMLNEHFVSIKVDREERPDVDAIYIDEPSAFERAREFLRLVMPKHVDRLYLYEGKEPLFFKYRLEKEIANIHRREVALKDGGSIVVDTTDALPTQVLSVLGRLSALKSLK